MSRHSWCAGSSRDRRRIVVAIAAIAVVTAAVAAVTAITASSDDSRRIDRPTGAGHGYPWHTDIVATTFWVGEVFDPGAVDGSQERSTYDSAWMRSYGGCDGVIVDGSCETERRSAADEFFPTRMTPLENPFYLDLPYDDVNDPHGFEMRGEVVPWAGDAAYRSSIDDRTVSLIKNRWVRLAANGRVCYGQVQDAGPGVYDDAAYVFGDDDRRPANTRFNGAGLDVSPAINGCLGFRELDGQDELVDWQFVEADEVPAGPWRIIVTTSGVQ
jgi:hypothetical protein